MSRVSTFALVTALLLGGGYAAAQAPRLTSRPIQFIPDAPLAVPAATPGFGFPSFPQPAPFPPGHVHPVSPFPTHPLPPPPMNRVLGVTFSMTVWGPQITSVLPNSVAQFSGLCVGDILLTANGNRLLSRNDFINHVSYSRHDVVIFQVWDARFGRAKLVRANFDFGNDLEVRSAPTGFRR